MKDFALSLRGIAAAALATATIAALIGSAAPTSALGVSPVPPIIDWASAAQVGPTDRASGQAVARDELGNVYVTGVYSGSLAFGDTRVTAQRGTETFIAKYNQGGELQWLFSSSGDGSSTPTAIAVSSVVGSVVVVGTFAGTEKFGDVSLSAGDAADSYVVRLSPNGVPIWGNAIAGTGTDEALGVAIAREPGGSAAPRLFVGGRFDGSISLGAQRLASAGGADAFLWTLDLADGASRLGQRWGGPGDDGARAVSVLDNDTVLATGYFEGRAVFGSVVKTAAGIRDLFVARLPAALPGVQAVATAGGPGARAEGTAIAYDTADVVGQFTDTITFGGRSITSAGRFDTFLVEYYGGLGSVIDVHRWGGTGNDIPTAVDDYNGGSFISGTFTDTARFGDFEVTSQGLTGGYLFAWDGSDVLWLSTLDGAGADAIRGVAGDGSGRAAFTSAYVPPASLDGNGVGGSGLSNVLNLQYQPQMRVTPSQQDLRRYTSPDVSFLSQPLETTNADGRVTYAISPALPAGFAFDPATGVIAGSSTVPVGQQRYTVTATDVAGRTSEADIIFYVARPRLEPERQVVSAVRDDAIAPTALLRSRDLTLPFTATVSPALPAGLSLDPGTGIISGVPTVASPETEYTITVLDSSVPRRVTSATITITVTETPAPPTPVTRAGKVTNARATAIRGGVRVNWAAPADTGGGTISGYQYRVGAGAWTDTGQTRMRVTDVRKGTLVTVRVRAVNEAGPGRAVKVSARAR